jgi:hypothetical protein
MDLLRKVFGLREDQERLIIMPLLFLIFLIILFSLRGCLPSRDAGALTFGSIGNVLPAASAPIINDSLTNNVQFAGSYLPNERVNLIVDGTFVAQVETDRLGRWTYETTLPDGQHNLRVTAERDGGTVESTTYPFIVRAVGSVDSDRSAVNYLPRIGESDTLNGVPIQNPLFGAGLDGGTFPAGRIALAGTSTPNSQVIVTTGDRTLARVRVGEDGRWALNSTFDEPGDYEIQVRSVESPDRPIDTINLTIGRTLQRPTIELNPDRSSDRNIVRLMGTGAPNTDLGILTNGQLSGVVTTDAAGNWTLDVELPADETDFEFVAVAAAEDALEPAISTPTRLRRAVLPPPAAEAVAVAFDPLLIDADSLAFNNGFASGAVDLTGTGEPVGARVLLLLDGVPLGSTTIDANGRWVLGQELNLAPGTYQLSAEIRDENDAVLATSNLTTIDIPEPAAEIGVEPAAVTLADNGFDLGAATIAADGTASGTLPLTGNVEPAGSRILFLLDGEVVGEAIAADDGTYRFDYGYELPPGTYQLVSQIVGADGTTLAESNATTIIIPETTAGENPATITLDDDGFTLDAATIADDGTASGTLELAGNVEPAGSTVLIYLDGEQIGEVDSADDGSYSFSYDYEFAPGSYELTSRVVDANGSTLAESTSRTVIIPEPDSAADSSLRVVFAGLGTDNAGEDAGSDGDSAGTDNLANSTLPAVELIVDASWSMTLDMSGENRLTVDDPDSRIAIAREALNTLVDELPDGLPIAVRGFGNRAAPYECQTELEQPLALLDREALRETLLGIEPQLNANTPIAQALSRVAQDLANFGGLRRVVLLTDGEENCGGNPAGAIQQLRDSGIDVTIDIVGFAIGDPALQAQFEDWAAIGGGVYYNAANAEDLATALQSAVVVPYRVFDADGVEVATGIVGGPAIDLPAGAYTVEVLTSPAQTFEVTVGVEPATLTLE